MCVYIYIYTYTYKRPEPLAAERVRGRLLLRPHRLQRGDETMKQTQHTHTHISNN